MILSGLRQSEQKYKTQQEIKEVREKINDLLQQEIEIKSRYLKQNYYDSGPKATKLMARQIRKQQTETRIHKMNDQKTNQLKYEPK